MPPGNAAVSLAPACSIPEVLPLPNALLLDLLLDVCEGCEGVAVPVGELCCTLCTFVYGLVSNNLCISWYPPEVDLDVVSILKGMLEVSDDLGGEVLSCC